MQAGLAVRDGQQVPAVRVGNRACDVRPAAHGVDGDDAVLQCQCGEELADGGQFVALGGHRGLADRQAAVQPGRDDVRAAQAAGRVARAAHRLAVDGAGLRRLRRLFLLFRFLFLLPGLRHCLAGRRQPHHQGLQLRQQIRAPVPQQAPQGLGAGNAVSQKAQPAQPGRMVPRKVGGVLRAVAVADRGQHVNGQQAGQGIHPAPPVPVVGDGGQVVHQPADDRFGKDIGLWDNGGHGGCDASWWYKAIHMKTQDGPLCCGNDLGIRTASSDPIC